MSIKYAAYGSNLNLRQMEFRCPTAKILGISEIKDYKLLFRSSFLTIEKSVGDSVPILIWSIEPRDEKSLDRYEGYPEFYRRETMRVILDGEPTEIMVYIMNDGHEIMPPGKFYYDGVLEGYKSAGFDTKVLKKALEESRVRHFV